MVVANTQEHHRVGTNNTIMSMIDAVLAAGKVQQPYSNHLTITTRNMQDVT